MTATRLTQALAGLAGAKIALALAAVAWAGVDGSIVQAGAPLTPLWVSTMLVVAYAAIGVLLLCVARSDRRAQELAIFLLLVATAFSHALTWSGESLGPLSRLALRCRIDVFLPAYLWMFVRDFPIRAPLGRLSSWPSRLVTVSVAVGAAVLTANLFVDLHGAYWPLLLVLMIPAAPVLLDRARHVGPSDRRRVQFFVIAMTGGLLPIALDVVLRAASHAWREMSGQPPWSWSSTLVLAALLSVPATTAYSVVVDRVLDLGLMARTALKYALTRYTILLLIAVPALWVAWSLFDAHPPTIAQLVAGRPVPLGTALIALVVLLPARQRLFHSLDRRFFRERYDSELILGRLVEASRSAESAAHLAELFASEIDRALHPERYAVLVRRDDLARFETMRGASRSLPTSSMLVTILSASDDPLEIEPHQPRSILQRLDAPSVAWIADGDFRILVPLRGASGALKGFIALAEKRSELPYSQRDRSMLAVIGAAGGLCLEAHSAQGKWGPQPAIESARTDVAARECPDCGLVFGAVTVSCACGAALEESLVPEVLSGKFKIERRIGAGGMGVVYRAADLVLGRTVAIKALRGPHAGDAWRLRREARAMALTTHPNLALVFGFEFWFGRPLLIVEYLSGGTLADRLVVEHRLPEAQVVRLGLTLAGVLKSLHGSGLLHRDIKPANIGFTADGVVKLLDFGLARQFLPAGDISTRASRDSTTAVQVRNAPATPSGRVIGTPFYMSPEALANETPDGRFDLWSLAVTLFEAMTGINPFRDRTLAALLAPQQAPDPRQFESACSAAAAAFFAAALAPSRAERPATAAAFAMLVKLHFTPQDSLVV
jgi:hypothetical protein